MQKYREITKMEGRLLTSEKNTDLSNLPESLTKCKSELQTLLPENAAELKHSIMHSLEISGCKSDKSVTFLLEKCTRLFYEHEYVSVMAHTEIVHDLAWEKLNSFHWKDVPISWQIVYSYACFFKACALAFNAENDASLVEICRNADMGLLMGHNILGGIFHKITEIFKPNNISWITPLNSCDCKTNQPAPKLINAINSLSVPSLEKFAHCMKNATPIVLEDCIEHWSARTLWNFEYLNKIAGHRIVPVELGSKYTDESWGQKLMTISDFISNYVFGNVAQPKAYLAQHRLFDRIPALKDDIDIPDYCCLSKLENIDPETDTEINVWFGPSGTVSPCHFDAKHNLLTQVVGRKYVRLYKPSCKDALYPHEGMLNNTSRVDVENPDSMKFPSFQAMDSVQREECILHPGQMLYIPPGYWHYVRSLDESFSVSFWWN